MSDEFGLMKNERNLYIEKRNAIFENVFSGLSRLVFVVDLATFDLIFFNNGQEAVCGKELILQKCYEFFGNSTPCTDCPYVDKKDNQNSPSSWERYDNRLNRFYLAERKTIRIPDGSTIEAAYVLDVTNQKRTEKVLFEMNEELHKRLSELEELSESLEEEIIERQAIQQELLKKTEEIQKIAYFDNLTGLPNRLNINETLEKEMTNARLGLTTGAILSIDLDDIKSINDTFGHKYGDALIKESALRILEVAGDDCFVGRLGGDEFIVILIGISDRKNVTDFADRINKVLSDSVEIYGMRFHISASAGVVIYPEHGYSVEEILKNVDNAMYNAKKMGKNCWRLYTTDMHEEAYDKLKLTNHLRYALDRAELSLHYQPQVSIKDGTIVGFEALLRWNSSEYGSIPPVRFIPLAEQSGLIQKIGKWVLREACQFIRRLEDKGCKDLRIAVNISPLQLIAKDFIDIVCEALSLARIEPQQLELEITENTLISSLEDGIGVLNKLQQLGVRLSLDDFGKGYSSLTYLQRLPVGTLKIDKAFIDMITTDESKKAIISTIIEMAHIMQMTVIAEGVENEEQLKYLAYYQCDCFQGYIMSTPVPEEEAVLFLPC